MQAFYFQFSIYEHRTYGHSMYWHGMYSRGDPRGPPSTIPTSIESTPTWLNDWPPNLKPNVVLLVIHGNQVVYNTCHLVTPPKLHL